MHFNKKKLISWYWKFKIENIADTKCVPLLGLCSFALYYSNKSHSSNWLHNLTFRIIHLASLHQHKRSIKACHKKPPAFSGFRRKWGAAKPFKIWILNLHSSPACCFCGCWFRNKNVLAKFTFLTTDHHRTNKPRQIRCARKNRWAVVWSHLVGMRSFSHCYFYILFVIVYQKESFNFKLNICDYFNHKNFELFISE